MKSERELQDAMKMQIGNTFVNVSLQELPIFCCHYGKKKFLGQESDKRCNFQRHRIQHE